MYVDDIIFAFTNLNLYQDFSKLLQSEFKMSMMGELTYFLGLQIKQCKNGTFLNQVKCNIELLKRFDVSNSKPFGTLISPSLKLDFDPNGKKVDVTLYRGMVESLLYLVANRLDIMLNVCLCARYQVDHKESHFSAIKHIMRYLMGTTHLGLWYPKCNICSLLSYSDVDFCNSRINERAPWGDVNLLTTP